MGLALQLPPAATAYNPVTSYVATNLVQIGPTFYWTYEHISIGTLYFSAPYGTTNANTVPITFSVFVADTLTVSITGSSPNQGINIALANATPSKNAASAIQAAIRALGSLNSLSSNYVDLSAWTVTPDSTYYAAPWITLSSYKLQGGWTNSNWIGECVLANQYDQFPLVGSNGLISNLFWNTTYWVDGSTIVEPPIEVVTPYTESDLFELDCSTQSADVLWVFHPNYPPAVIERLGANSWAYSISLPNQGPGESPYRGTLDVVRTGYSALGQSITSITQANPCVVTVSATTAVFSYHDRIYMNLIAGMVELNEGEFLINSPTVNADGTFSFSLLDPNSLANVDSTGFLAYVSGGFAVQVVPMFATNGDYPACGTLYQERLFLAGSDNNPLQMNGSVQGDYPNFICDPNQDDYAVQFTLVSNKLDQILNMIGTPNCLLIGTAGGAWIMAGSNGASISQTNVNASKQTSMGISPLQPQLVNDSVIFVSRSAKIVMFIVYNFASNQWDNYDLTRLNRNITFGPTEALSGIVQTAFQMEPYPIYWAVRADGQLIGLVFNKQDQVFAWFRVNMQPQGGNIESVAVISGANQEDQVVVVVNRTINGATQRSVEYFMQQDIFGELSNAFFVYSGQQWNGGPAVTITGISQANPTVVTAVAHGFTNGMMVQISDVQGMIEINQDATEAYTVAGATTDTFQLQGMDSTAFGAYTGGGIVKHVSNQVTGLSYLLGQEVVATGDGALILSPTVVTSDTMTFDYYYNLLTIGIPYEMILRPTNPTLSTQSSTTGGMPQKLSRVTISLYQSMGGQYGTDLDHMYDITYGTGTMGQVPQMSTAEFTRDMDADWSEESTFYITHDDPLPFTVRGLVMRMSVNQD